MCSDPGDVNKINPDLNRFWTKTLKQTHTTASKWFDKVDPDAWHKDFLSKISSAVTPVPIFRHFEEEANIAYKTTNSITAEEWQNFVNQVKLPHNRIGRFKEDAFDKAVTAVIDTWNHIFIDINNGNPDGPTTYLRNWNLDTGVDEDKPEFW
jgi:hypothetical protein